MRNISGIRRRAAEMRTAGARAEVSRTLYPRRGARTTLSLKLEAGVEREQRQQTDKKAKKKKPAFGAGRTSC